MSSKFKIVLVQLGSPKSPTVSDVRTFLREFLGDPRVVDINPYLWKIILNLFVLPLRPFQSAKAYRRLWDRHSGKYFPLIHFTASFAAKVQRHIGSKSIEVEHGFLLSSPRVGELLDRWEAEDPATRADTLVVIPQFPQYAEATTASGLDALSKELSKRAVLPRLYFHTHYHDSRAFIESSVRIIQDTLKQNPGVDYLLFSFHGIPKRRVVEKKDPYYRQCLETFALLRDRLKGGQAGLSSNQIGYSFQSRFGSEEWLTPYTTVKCEELVQAGKRHIAVYCPSFVVDCLETEDEIGCELKHEVEELGAKLTVIPCLNDDPIWAQAYGDHLKELVDHIPAPVNDQLIVSSSLTQDLKMELDSKDLASPPLTPEAKVALKNVFLTLFLDLVGFSIIFPLFPALARYYLEVDQDNVFLQFIFRSVSTLMSYGPPLSSNGHLSPTSIVLFGGVLGALYSFLQFLASPFWGGLSDKIGRRPVLLVSVFFLAISYLLWFFAGSFTVLILGRFLGGIMGGNIATASAVVSDVTTRKNRSKGMAVIGIAFALGFIIGPAIGGILSHVDLTVMYPGLVAYGVNPFSSVALFACMLSILNFYFIKKSFKESLPPEKRGQKTSERLANPLKLFSPLPFKGVNQTNYAYFIFISAFSGMEFTLTFLAVERLNYTSMDNAKMFVFIGFILTLVQGGIVRRYAHKVGEKKMAALGLAILIPGLLFIAPAQTTLMLYLGLFCLAVGSALIIPCLTSLVSFYTPNERQGEALGVFRSLGALARVIGPIAASLIYWRYGSGTPYWLGAAILLIPIALVLPLPAVQNAPGDGSH